jgi:hypothetical protein
MAKKPKKDDGFLNETVEDMGNRKDQDSKSKEENYGDDQAFAQAIEGERVKEWSVLDLDGSASLIQGLDCENEEDDFEALNYPFLKVYAGERGTFELKEKGKRNVKKITEDKYPLPLDTDIVKINAYRVVAGGDWEKVTNVGDFVINATRVEFENCCDLERLPPMNTVQKLEVGCCFELRYFDPLTRVNELEIKYSGIQFLPKSLATAKITLDNCPGLQYIHPAIPIASISGMKDIEIKVCKMRYMLSEHVSDLEKRLYPITEKNILINNPKLRILPECFNRTNVILEDCHSLEFIHPSIDPKKVKGMDPKDIYHCQMMYLFKKMNDDDPSFNMLFKRVKDRYNRTRE